MMLSSADYLTSLARLAKDRQLPIFLVGGCVRDQLLGRASADYDLICPTDPTGLAQRFARLRNGHWFWLDRERCYSRVLFQHTPQPQQFDFAPFRAPTLEQDLAERDFTINAIARQLNADGSLSPLIDPLNGQDALFRRRLRQCSAASIPDDPLRLVKGLRHCAQLGLEVDPTTWQQMCCQVAMLDQVAGERLRYEVAMILRTDDWRHGVTLLQQSGAAAALGWPMTEKNQAAADDAFWPATIDSSAFRQDEFDMPASVRFVHYLASLDDILNVVSSIVQRLKCSRRLGQLICFGCRFMVAERHSYESLMGQGRGRLLWLEQAGAPLPEALLVLAADRQLSMPLRQHCLERFVDRGQWLHNGRVKPLLTGQQLRHLRPDLQGGDLGRAVQALKQAEINGQVTSAAQGEIYLTQWCETD